MAFQRAFEKAQEDWNFAVKNLTAVYRQKEEELARNPLLPALRSVLAGDQPANATQKAGAAARAAKFKLNVGGEIIYVDRETLTHFPASRLGRVFREGWEGLLPKDKDGNIFLDLDPDQFFGIVDFVDECRKKQPEEELPQHPELCSSLEEEGSRWGLAALCAELGLAALGTAADATALGTVQKLLDKQQELLTTVVQEQVKEPVLEKMIKALEDTLPSLKQSQEEQSPMVSKSVAAFHSAKQWEQDLSQREVLAAATDVDKEKRFLMHLAGRGVVEGSQEPVQIVQVVAKRKGILKAFRATLCQSPKLAELLKELPNEESEPTLQVPYDPVTFKMVVQFLRMKSMGLDMEAPCMKGPKGEKLHALLEALAVEAKWKVGKLDSALLSNAQQTAFFTKFKEVQNMELELLYRGSRDGWKAATFHSFCNYQGPTVTIVKSAQGHVFGGFTDLSWDSSGQYKNSQAAFLFKLGQHDQVNVSRCDLFQNHGNAIHCRGDYGPTFGGGHDLHIVLNGTASAQMNLGNTYTRAPGNVQFLGEGQNCPLSEVEVFACRSRESLILSEGQRAALLKELGKLQIEKLQLIYRGSRDGFTAQNFHQRCDKVGRTVTLVKSAQGHVFGGFSDVAWDSSGEYGNSQAAFLFKLGQNDQVNLSTHDLFQNYDYAVYCEAGVGPSFGGNHDFQVALNGTATASMNLGHTYNKGPGNVHFLAETQNCALTEVEVFAIQDEGSVILSQEQKAALLQQFQGNLELCLLYRGSRDGFTSQSFHQRCDEVARTVTVLKSAQGHVFGGYCNVVWDSASRWKHSAAAFLFKLGQADQVAVSRHDVAEDQGLQNAIYCNGGYGPTFGDGHNLRVVLDGPQNSSAQMQLHYTYNLPEFLAESQNPALMEVEVFALVGDNSTVFSEAQRVVLLQQLEPAGLSKLRLLYRGSRDGFTARSFHQRCDNAGRTVTVAKSAQGHVFGGFSDVAWDSSGQYKHSRAAFLFKLGQHDQVTLSKHELFQNHGHAVYCEDGYGPTFGGGHDLYIGLNGTGSAQMNLGNTYNRGPGNVQFLGEGQNCVLADVEVYAVD